MPRKELSELLKPEVLICFQLIVATLVLHNVVI